MSTAQKIEAPVGGNVTDWIAFIVQLISVFPMLAEALRRIITGHDDGMHVRDILGVDSHSAEAAKQIREHKGQP